MKYFIGVIMLLLMHCLAYGQSAAPKVLLPQADSMVIAMDKLFINPKNIKDLFVLKDPTPELLKSYRGANLIMTFKKTPRLVALNNLKVDSIEKKESPALYVIDGIPVNDTTGVKMDALSIKEFTSLSESVTAKGFVFCAPPKPIYLISTKYKGKKIKQPK